MTLRPTVIVDEQLCASNTALAPTFTLPTTLITVPASTWQAPVIVTLA